MRTYNGWHEQRKTRASLRMAVLAFTELLPTGHDDTTDRKLTSGGVRRATFVPDGAAVLGCLAVAERCLGRSADRIGDGALPVVGRVR
jgi:hypothetical protein